MVDIALGCKVDICNAGFVNEIGGGPFYLKKQSAIKWFYEFVSCRALPNRMFAYLLCRDTTNETMPPDNLLLYC